MKGATRASARRAWRQRLARWARSILADGALVGLGTDLDVEGPGFAGVGLALGALCVHVAVFPA